MESLMTKMIDELFKNWLDKNYLIEVKSPRKPFQEFDNQDDSLCKKAFEGGYESAQALSLQGAPASKEDNLKTILTRLGERMNDAEKAMHSQDEKVKRIVEIEQAQALLSQGEPVGYAPKEYLADIKKEAYVLVHKEQKGIYDTPIYTSPLSSEALQKDKAELIEQLESYKADAERYRWLRGDAGNEILEKLKNMIIFESFDEAIDQAMKEGKDEV